jgi:hypothetical protein
MKSIEKQQENISNLLELIKDNPELEIMPMVNNECVGGDDFGYWAAKWGDARVDEQYCPDERIYFKSCDIEELVQEFIDNNYEEYPDLSDEELEKLAEEKVSDYDWQKVIVVYIKPL